MTIKEVSEKFQISQDTLRYYERIGLIPRVKRGKNGNRDYDKESLGWVDLAICMRSAGVAIEPLIEYCELTRQGDATIVARKELLEGERQKLLEKKQQMEETLERLNYKIERYQIAEETGVLSWDHEKCEGEK